MYVVIKKIITIKIVKNSFYSTKNYVKEIFPKTLILGI